MFIEKESFFCCPVYACGVFSTLQAFFYPLSTHRYSLKQKRRFISPVSALAITWPIDERQATYHIFC